MTSRERVLAALNHRQPDRVPIDFGSTPVSGMHVSCVADLRDYYGLEKRPVKVHEPYQILGLIEEDLMEAMGLDVQSGTDRNTIFGFINQNWKPWKTQQGLDVLVAGDFNTKVEANGDTLIYPQGDTGAPPSGRMPKGGYYFDAIVRQEPIDEAKLNPQDNLEEFKPIADESLAGIKKDVEKVVSTGRAVVANFGGTAFGDIALVPAPFLKHPKGIRDIAEWYMSTVTRQDYIHKIFSAQCEIALGNLEKAYAALGDAVDVVFICGTDFGTQTSTFCSEETYRSLYMPYYKRINQWVHENTNWKTFKHSCGSVVLFLDAFIESGFDIVNPVQCSAAGMDPGILKNKWGDRLVFWGAGVDTQKVLPFGTADQVREQVLSRCEIFSKNGGFIFNSIHNVQCRTPVENI
ncbi:MAG: uroporphyrinogen decarboxylase family protein, partial [Planctomycetota bacterium]